MHISYQGVPGAYGSIVAETIADRLSIPHDAIHGLPSFAEVWESIDADHIAVLPIENSYAGSIHENFYAFLRYDYAIVGEVSLPIHHTLLSLETDISQVKKAYSHPQALAQCHDWLRSLHIEAVPYEDTAGAARMIAEKSKRECAAIASRRAGEIYGLHMLAEGIQDQVGNTTRFVVVTRWPEAARVREMLKTPNTRSSILFETGNVPAVLYKCLGAFATNGVNLTKIESLPSLKGPFSYLFWIDIDGTIDDPSVVKALDELKFFTLSIRILGTY